MPTILMMDDDKDFSSLVQANFSGQGYNVVLAHNGREGLAKAAAVKPDIIFLDIMMPDMNGIEVLRELQAADAGGRRNFGHPGHHNERQVRGPEHDGAFRPGA